MNYQGDNSIAIGYYAPTFQPIINTFLNYHNFIKSGGFNNTVYNYYYFINIEYDYDLIMKTKEPLNKEFIAWFYHPSRINSWIGDIINE
jgi:hypothetical protein